MFLGIDGCRGGWCVARLDTAGRLELEVVRSFTEVAVLAEASELTLVDMPIGLLDAEADPAERERRADVEARKHLGRAASSIFPTPVRQAVYAADYSQAAAEQRKVTGKGLSLQSWALAPKIREVDLVLRQSPSLADRIVESHPELCFTALNDWAPLGWSKRHTLGVLERVRLLGPELGDVPGLLLDQLSTLPPAMVGGDDALDAMVLAVHARAASVHGFMSCPPSPPRDRYGLPMRIVAADLSRKV